MQIARREVRLRSKVVRPRELNADERALWHQICQTDKAFANPFYALEFVQSVSDSNVDVRVCVIERNGRTAGFFPFQFASGTMRRLAAAERVGGELSDYCGIVAEDDLRLDPGILLHLSKLSSFSFSHLDETQIRFGLAGEAPEIGLLVKLEYGGHAHWQDISSRDKMLAGDTRRKIRRLAENFGPLRFDFAEREPHATVDRLIELKRNQYARTSVKDVLSEPWTRALLHRLADSTDVNCSGVTSSLYAGDTWLASHLGLRSRDVLHYWFPVYNPELERFSPGRLLYKGLVEAADEHRFKLIDDGAGDTRAKRDFSNSSHTYYRGRWQRPGLRSLTVAVTMGVHWRLEAWHRRRSQTPKQSSHRAHAPERES